ncbi:MAG: single-stranded-DNA-specific exonuclease RecJ [Pseudomonadota bacterium]
MLDESNASALPPASLFLQVERSITGRRWVARDAAAERLGLAIAQTHGLPEIVGRVLGARGVPVEEAAAYLAPTLRDLMPDPHRLTDMEAAADRLARAAQKRERVAVFGDYDVDGAASSALLVRWLRHFGIEATLYIPDRIDEGYGPNEAAMTALGEAHDLLIAVDCGTLAFEPIAAARAAGADVIVADHHLAAETVPECVAVVNPNRNDDESGLGYLCAAGVVFLLLIAAQRRLRDLGACNQTAPPDLMGMLDMVALATVADVAPLVGLNRALVRQGLKVMGRRLNPGLRALSDVARLTSAPTAYHLGYVLGPRVNAGGRVGQADLGARLLATDSYEEASALAERLDGHNAERRAIEAGVLDGAIQQVELRDGGPSAPLVWAAAEGWHPGVVGIVASRLKEKYNRPALVIGFDAEGVGKGSGRSIEGVDLGRSVATCAREGLFVKGGGHKMAAGVTADHERLPDALKRLTELLAAQGAGRDGPRDLRFDGALAPTGATLELLETLEAAGPFGPSNPAPRFAIPDAKISWAKPAGESHLRFTATDGSGGKLEAIAFGAFDGPLGPFLAERKGRPTHLAGRIEIDDWGGRRRPKLRVEDAADPAH